MLAMLQGIATVRQSAVASGALVAPGIEDGLAAIESIAHELEREADVLAEHLSDAGTCAVCGEALVCPAAGSHGS